MKSKPLRWIVLLGTAAVGVLLFFCLAWWAGWHVGVPTGQLSPAGSVAQWTPRRTYPTQDRAAGELEVLAQQPTAPKPPLVSTAVPAVKVTWRFDIPASTISDAAVEKGTREIPLTTSCAGRFRIDKLAWSNVLRLDIRITKLFAGRGLPPELTIEGKGVGPPSSERFVFSNLVDVNRWPTKGYQLTGTFSPTSIPMPKFWTRVVLTCED